eukprot:TRINITY_DN908_c0_g2_i2.p1 TRINITY_DN908_c0_g2~~TRINITY_DN908_c0_g2_i2.p1  ORF type:complete len:1076 (+),score=84.75 TRINITY_DN908_c0_g2_i2:46-3273(+)
MNYNQQQRFDMEEREDGEETNVDDLIYAIVASTAISGIVAVISSVAPLASAMLVTAIAAAIIRLKATKIKEEEEYVDNDKETAAITADQPNSVMKCRQGTLRQVQPTTYKNKNKHSALSLQNKSLRGDSNKFETQYLPKTQNLNQTALTCYSRQAARKQQRHDDLCSFIIQQIQNPSYKLTNIKVFCDLNSINISQFRTTNNSVVQCNQICGNHFGVYKGDHCTTIPNKLLGPSTDFVANSRQTTSYESMNENVIFINKKYYYQQNPRCLNTQQNFITEKTKQSGLDNNKQDFEAQKLYLEAKLNKDNINSADNIEQQFSHLTTAQIQQQQKNQQEKEQTLEEQEIQYFYKNENDIITNCDFEDICSTNQNDDIFLQDQIINNNESQTKMDKCYSISLRQSTSSFNSGDEQISPQPLNDSVQKFFTQKKIDAFLLDIDFEFQFQTLNSPEFTEFDFGFTPISPEKRNSAHNKSCEFSLQNLQGNYQKDLNVGQFLNKSELYGSSKIQNKKEFNEFASEFCSQIQNNKNGCYDGQYFCSGFNQNNYQQKKCSFDQFSDLDLGYQSMLLNEKANQFKQNIHSKQQQMKKQFATDSKLFQGKLSKFQQFKKQNYHEITDLNLSKINSEINSKSLSSFGNDQDNERKKLLENKVILQNTFSMDKQQKVRYNLISNQLYSKQLKNNTENMNNQQYLYSKQPQNKYNGSFDYKNNQQKNSQQIYDQSNTQIIKHNFKNKFSKNYPKNNLLMDLKFDDFQMFEFLKNWQHEYSDQFLSCKKNLRIVLDDQPAQYSQVFSPQSPTNIQTFKTDQINSEKQDLQISINTVQQIKPNILQFLKQQSQKNKYCKNNKNQTRINQTNFENNLRKQLYSNSDYNEVLNNSKNLADSFEAKNQDHQFSNNLDYNQKQKNISNDQTCSNFDFENFENNKKQIFIDTQINDTSEFQSVPSKNKQICSNKKLNELIQNFELENQDQQIQINQIQLEKQILKSSKLTKIISNFELQNFKHQKQILNLDTENNNIPKSAKIDKMVKYFEPDQLSKFYNDTDFQSEEFNMKINSLNLRADNETSNQKKYQTIKLN